MKLGEAQASPGAQHGIKPDGASSVCRMVWHTPLMPDRYLDALGASIEDSQTQGVMDPLSILSEYHFRWVARELLPS